MVIVVLMLLVLMILLPSSDDSSQSVDYGETSVEIGRLSRRFSSMCRRR